RSFALGLLHAFLAVASPGFFFRQPALLAGADLGVGERAGARGTLILGQGAKHHAGTGTRRRRRRCRSGRRGLGRRRLGGRLRRVRFRRGCITRDAALAAFLDHHLLGAAVAEALAHGARLDARLERQGLARDTQWLVARSFPIHHSAVLILVSAVRRRTVVGFRQLEFVPAAPAVLSSSAIRYRTRVWLRDRNVLLAGPASSAACITFDRPSAKSNCADVSAVTIGNPPDLPIFPGFCRANASNLRIPSPAPSQAWIKASTAASRRGPARAASTLLKPDTTWPALAAIASASIVLCTSRASVSSASVG